MKKRLPVLIICFLITACSNLQNNAILEKQNIIVDGIKREYILYIPQGIPSNPPFVMALHGYTDNDSAFMKYSGLNEVAARNGFAIYSLKDQSEVLFASIAISFASSTFIS